MVVEVKGNVQFLDLFAWPSAHLFAEKKLQGLPRLFFYIPHACCIPKVTEIKTKLNIRSAYCFYNLLKILLYFNISGEKKIFHECFSFVALTIV